MYLCLYVLYVMYNLCVHTYVRISYCFKMYIMYRYRYIRMYTLFIPFLYCIHYFILYSYYFHVIHSMLYVYYCLLFSCVSGSVATDLPH